MRDKNGKESSATRWVDNQGQQQVVSEISYSIVLRDRFHSFLGNESW